MGEISQPTASASRPVKWPDRNTWSIGGKWPLDDHNSVRPLSTCNCLTREIEGRSALSSKTKLPFPNQIVKQVISVMKNGKSRIVWWPKSFNKHKPVRIGSVHNNCYACVNYHCILQLNLFIQSEVWNPITVVTLGWLW